jgi:hypothetical protein
MGVLKDVFFPPQRYPILTVQSRSYRQPALNLLSVSRWNL